MIFSGIFDIILKFILQKIFFLLTLSASMGTIIRFCINTHTLHSLELIKLFFLQIPNKTSLYMRSEHKLYFEMQYSIFVCKECSSFLQFTCFECKENFSFFLLRLNYRVSLYYIDIPIYYSVYQVESTNY